MQKNKPKKTRRLKCRAVLLFALFASSGDSRQGYKEQTYVLCYRAELKGTCCVMYTTCVLPGRGITVATVARTGSAELICILYDSG